MFGSSRSLSILAAIVTAVLAHGKDPCEQYLTAASAVCKDVDPELQQLCTLMRHNGKLAMRKCLARHKSQLYPITLLQNIPNDDDSPLAASDASYKLADALGESDAGTCTQSDAVKVIEKSIVDNNEAIKKARTSSKAHTTNFEEPTPTSEECKALGVAKRKHYHQEYKFMKEDWKSALKSKDKQLWVIGQRNIESLYRSKYGKGGGFFNVVKPILGLIFGSLGTTLKSKVCLMLFPKGWKSAISGSIRRASEELMVGEVDGAVENGIFDSIKNKVTSSVTDKVVGEIKKFLKKQKILEPLGHVCGLVADLIGDKVKIEYGEKINGTMQINLTRTGYITAHDGKVHKEGGCQANAIMRFRECLGCCCESYVDAALSVTQNPYNSCSKNKRTAKKRSLMLGASFGSRRRKKSGSSDRRRKTSESSDRRRKKTASSDRRRKQSEDSGRRRKQSEDSGRRRKNSGIDKLGSCPVLCPALQGGTCSHSESGDGVDESKVQQLCSSKEGQSCERPMRCGKWIQFIDLILSTILKAGSTLQTTNYLGGHNSAANCYDRSNSDLIKGCCKLAAGNSDEADELRSGKYLPKRPKEPSGVP